MAEPCPTFAKLSVQQKQENLLGEGVRCHPQSGKTDVQGYAKAGSHRQHSVAQSTGLAFCRELTAAPPGPAPRLEWAGPDSTCKLNFSCRQPSPGPWAGEGHQVPPRRVLPGDSCCEEQAHSSGDWASLAGLKGEGGGGFGSGIPASAPVWPGKGGGDHGIWRSCWSQALFTQVSSSYFPTGGDVKAKVTVQENPLTNDPL